VEKIGVQTRQVNNTPSLHKGSFAECEKGEPEAGLSEKLFFLTDDTCTGNE
jgi:hypothetical protein